MVKQRLHVALGDLLNLAGVDFVRRRLIDLAAVLGLMFLC
jgi:hypothetical protein